MAEATLQALANRTNQSILALLAVEPTYPRKIGSLLSLSEAEVARRLRHMESLGLVSSTWSYIGKNVKMYTLLAGSVSLKLGPAGLQVELHAGDGKAPTMSVVNPFVSEIPVDDAFLGREAELAAMAGSDPVIIVLGMPGIGKTSLLSRFARGQAAQRGVLWHSFRGVESLNWLANRLAVFLAREGEPALLEASRSGAELTDKRELMLRSLDDSRFVFVFDDVHSVVDEAVRDFLRDAVDRTRRGKLVLGSREQLRFTPAPGRVRVVELEGLTDAEVQRFCSERALEVPPDLLPRVREEVGGHPLALNLLLASARERGSLEALLDRIPEKNLEEYLLREVDATLSEDEREVLAHASVFRTKFTLDDLAAVSRRNPEHALFKLRRRFLVEGFSGAFGLHEILRNFFYTFVKNKRELHERAALHYLSQGSVEGRLESLHHFLQAGRRDRVLELLEQNLDLREFDFIDAGYQNLYLTVLQLFPRSEVPDARRWALIEDEKGDIMLHRGELAQALEHYAEASAFFQGPRGDKARVADLCWKRGLGLIRLGKRREAAALVEEGLSVAPPSEAGDLARTRLEDLRAQLKKG